MTNEEIIKEIEESAKLKQTKVTVTATLCHTRGILEQKADSENVDAAYNKGLEDGRNEAWELARRITGAKCDGGLQGHLTKVFETSITRVIFKCNTYREALAKIEAYDEEQKEIKVGDVVTDDSHKTQILVTEITDSHFNGIKVTPTDAYGKIGGIYTLMPINEYHKTGVKFDIINALNNLI